MKPLLFKNDTKTFDTVGKIITTSPGARFNSITSFTKGSLYCEITHIEGSSYHIIGILCDCGGIFYYPEGLKNNQLITVRGCLADGDSYQRKEIPFSIPSKSIVGIVMNLDNNLFSIFYKTNFYTYEYKKPPENTKLNINFGGGNSNQKYDKITLNFGNEPFTYNIPSNAIALLNSQTKIPENKLSFTNLRCVLFICLIHKN